MTLGWLLVVGVGAYMGPAIPGLYRERSWVGLAFAVMFAAVGVRVLLHLAAQ